MGCSDFGSSEKYKTIKIFKEANNNCKCSLIQSTKTYDIYHYKIINISDSDDESVKRIKNDMEMLKELNHPNIILLIDSYFSDDNKTLNIITEYADSGDIQKKLDEQTTKKEYFEEGTLLDWLMQICLALKYIHEKNIIHRDIKPSNILLMKNIAKLGDFGVAKAVSPTLKYTKTMVATPKYLAPEIINKEKYSFKADIWSLGITFFQLVYLEYPFEGKNEAQILTNILEGNKKEIKNPNSYDQKLIELINKMLSKRPEERPSAEEILENTIISTRMSCYLKENNYELSQAEKSIKEYEDNNKKKEAKKKKKIKIIGNKEIQESLNDDNLDINKKIEKKAKYDLNRQMTLMQKELLKKNMTCH